MGPVSGGFLLPTAILFQIGTELGDTSNIAWIPGGWSIASSVSFSIAGSLSDIFGRRYVTLSGQAFAVVGAVSDKFFWSTSKICTSSLQEEKED